MTKSTGIIWTKTAALVFSIVLLLPVLAAHAETSDPQATGAAPQKAEPNLLETMSYKDVVRLLQGSQITSKLITSDDGVSYVVGTHRNTSFIVRLLGCKTKKAERCTTLAIFANFVEDDGKKISDEDKIKINQYNENEVFGRAYYSDDETSLGVDTVISIEGGATEAYVKAQLNNWTRALGRFLSLLADPEAKKAQ